MTLLVPMRPGYFDTFAERTIERYAHENIASFRWSEDDAALQARAQFRRLLPHGLTTAGHHLFEILDQPDGATVGGLWYAYTSAREPGSAYLYDLHIDPEFRRARHATVALQWLEARCRAAGAAALELQVFAHSTLAQAHYVSRGYSVTSYNMAKRLCDA